VGDADDHCASPFAKPDENSPQLDIKENRCQSVLRSTATGSNKNSITGLPPLARCVPIAL
jgi:hypothetical protein